MNTIITLLNSNFFLKSTYTLFVMVWLFIIIGGGYNLVFELSNGDDYLGMFKHYLQDGHYNSVATDASVLYFLALSFIHKFTNNIQHCFYILNFFSWLFILIYSFFILKKTTLKKDKYFYIITSILIIFIINEKYFLRVANDSFQAIFILLFLNALLNLKKESSARCFIFIGIYLGLVGAVRSTAVFLIPILFYKLAVYLYQNQENYIKKSTNFGALIISLSLILLLFHYPSIIEKGALSYENKNPKNNISNWTQRDYLGLKKIQKDPLTRSHLVIWELTFDEVDAYLIKNGMNSLPRSHKEFIIKDPLLFFENGIVNIINVMYVYFKYWGLLFLLPLLPLLNFKKTKENIIDRSNHPIIFFLIFSIFVSMLCLTIVEFRWFVGYQILIPIAILTIINKQKNLKYINLIFSISLLMITVFNFKLVISIFSTLI